MANQVNGVKFEADLVILNGGVAQSPLARRSIRGQNFLIEWFEA